MLFLSLTKSAIRRDRSRTLLAQLCETYVRKQRRTAYRGLNISAEEANASRSALIVPQNTVAPVEMSSFKNLFS
jgi:hypothetical protein